MNNLKYIFVSIIVFILLIVGVGAFFFGDKYALDNLSFKSITPYQAADAMKLDNFYAFNRENTLQISGRINSITKKGNYSVIGLQTNSSFKLYCNIVGKVTNLTQGSTVTIFAEAENAQRQSSAVVFNNCVI